MTPTTYKTFRSEVKQIIVYLLSAANKIHACDMEEVLNIVNPVLVVQMQNGQPISVAISNDHDQEHFKQLLKNLKTSAI